MSIIAEGLTHLYNAGTPNARVALRDINLRIEDGSLSAIVGVTGSGKSTLVQHFNGLLRPTSGRLLIDDFTLDAHTTRATDLAALRRRVGLLFQFPEAQLFARTVYDDVAFGPRQLGLSDSAIRKRVRYGLRAVALDDEALWLRSPFALSGGQRRRVALAGVLAMRPHTLVLDEPSAGLDTEGRDELYARLSELRTRDGLTIVLVSHDMSEVARLADTLFVLSDGELRLSGSPDTLFRQVDDIVACGLLPPPLAQVAALGERAGLAARPARLTVDALERAIISRLGGAAAAPNIAARVDGDAHGAAQRGTQANVSE